MVQDQKRASLTVLILADGMPGGGLERQIVNLLQGLSKEAPSITTVFGVLVKGGAREPEAVRWADQVLPIRQRHRFDISLAWSICRFVREYKIDVIHTFGSIADLSGVVAAKWNNIPLINGSIRNAREKLTLRDRLSKIAMVWADSIVANSQAGVAAYQLAQQTKARVIYNGVDFERFETIPPYEHGHPYLLMVANFSAKKDQPAAIRALHRVRLKYPDLHLILVGKGHYEGSCRSLVQQLGLAAVVLIDNNCDDPRRYIAGAAVCLLLSPDGEGLSNVIIEYLACAKPVIATNKGGNRELIEHQSSGWLVATHDPAEISTALEELLSHPEQAHHYGLRGKARVQEMCGLRRMIAAYATLYQSLVTKQ